MQLLIHFFFNFHLGFWMLLTPRQNQMKETAQWIAIIQDKTSLFRGRIAAKIFHQNRTVIKAKKILLFWAVCEIITSAENYYWNTNMFWIFLVFSYVTSVWTVLIFPAKKLRKNTGTLMNAWVNFIFCVNPSWKFLFSRQKT